MFGIMEQKGQSPQMAKVVELEGEVSAWGRRIKALEDELLAYKKVLREETDKEIAEVEATAEKEIEAARNTAAANVRWNKRDVADEEMLKAGEEIKALMNGNPPVPVFDALKTVAAMHPGLTMQLARKFLKF